MCKQCVSTLSNDLTVRILAAFLSISGLYEESYYFLAQKVTRSAGPGWVPVDSISNIVGVSGILSYSIYPEVVDLIS